MHTYSLLHDHADRSTIAPDRLPLLDDFLARQKALQHSLLRADRAEDRFTPEQTREAAVLDHFRLLQATDNLSLLTCVDFRQPAHLLHPLPVSGRRTQPRGGEIGGSTTIRRSILILSTEPSLSFPFPGAEGGTCGIQFRRRNCKRIYNAAPLRDSHSHGKREADASKPARSRKQRHMSRNNAPAFGKAHPHLTLSSRDRAPIHGAFEFERDAAEVAPESDDIESPNRPREVHGRASFAKGFDLFDAVKIFRHAEAHRMRRSPEHSHQRLGIVSDQSSFVAGIEACEFGDNFRVVDSHGRDKRFKESSRRQEHAWESPHSP